MRILLLVVVLETVISVVMPRLSGQVRLEISFLPQLLIAFVALVLVLNLRVTSQRKSLLSVSKALLDSISYIDRLEEFSSLIPKPRPLAEAISINLFNRSSRPQIAPAPRPHCVWLRWARTEGPRLPRPPTRLSMMRHWFCVPIFAVPTILCATPEISF